MTISVCSSQCMTGLCLSYATAWLCWHPREDDDNESIKQQDFNNTPEKISSRSSILNGIVLYLIYISYLTMPVRSLRHAWFCQANFSWSNWFHCTITWLRKHFTCINWRHWITGKTGHCKWHINYVKKQTYRPTVKTNFSTMDQHICGL